MSDCKNAFETSTAKRFPGLDLSLDSDGDYDDLDAQQHWQTWQASRQALEGEPVAYIEGNDVYFEGQGDINDYIRQNGEPLYTHPASAVVPDDEYVRVLQETFDIIQADANTEQNYGSLCRIGGVLAKLKAGQGKDL